MLLVEARIHALAGEQETVAGALAQLAAASLAEDGCLEFLAARPLSAEGGEFVVLSGWRDEPALRAHYDSPAYAAYAAAATPLLARPTATAVHTVSATSHPIGDPASEPIRQD